MLVILCRVCTLMYKSEMGQTWQMSGSIMWLRRGFIMCLGAIFRERKSLQLDSPHYRDWLICGCGTWEHG